MKFCRFSFTCRFFRSCWVLLDVVSFLFKCDVDLCVDDDERENDEQICAKFDDDKRYIFNKACIRFLQLVVCLS